MVFRQTDPRYPFLWEEPWQPPGRWHGAGEGPVHYFSDSPDGAWAELLRHEEITAVEDLVTVRRSLWSVEIPDQDLATPNLPREVTTGGPATYASCQAEARRLRSGGATGLNAPNAALAPGQAGGQRVDGGLKPGPRRDGHTIVLFGRRPDLVGWRACATGHPAAELLRRVRHF